MRRTCLRKLTCLVRTDNSSPFRWMGAICAVYAYSVQLKAERRSERTCRRRRRPAKRRGVGSLRRSRERRAMVRSAPRIYETDMLRAMEFSARKLSRIDKLDNRFATYLSSSLKAIARLKAEVDGIGKSLSEIDRKDSGTRGKVDFLEDLASSKLKGERGFVQRLLLACSGRWGLPRDATIKRLSMVADRSGYGSDDPLEDPLWRAIPRLKKHQLVIWQRDNLKHDRIKFESQPCDCKLCRVSVLCSQDHGVSPGNMRCMFCGWLRHTGRAKRVRFARQNRT